MVKGKTPSGFKFALDEAIKTDWLLLKSIENSESNDLNLRLKATIRLVSLLFGSDEKEEEYYQFVAPKYNGHVPFEVLRADVTAMLTALNDSENVIKK
jgi:hypothetical protein